MANWIETLNALDYLFLLCALLGGIPLIIRFIMLFMGADFGGDSILDADVDAPDMGDGFDADASLRFLSLHGITSFLMMFGLVGYALYRHNEAGALVSLGGATAAGLACFWVIGWLFKSIAKLQHSGTLDLNHTVGALGSVYLTIHAGQTGRVNVEVDGRLREFDAVAASGLELPTGTLIRVVRRNGNVLVVEPTEAS